MLKSVSFPRYDVPIEGARWPMSESEVLELLDEHLPGIRPSLRGYRVLSLRWNEVTQRWVATVLGDPGGGWMVVVSMDEHRRTIVLEVSKAH
jgi:hypothetical protein